jgi:hypothetical protein
LGDSGLIDNGTAIYTTTRNVGIGTAAPGAQLQVERAGGAVANAEYIRLRNLTNATGSNVTIGMFVANNPVATGYISHVIAAGPSYDTTFSNWNGSTAAEVMRIAGSTGNVGIGTASPTGRLHVVGGTAAASTNGAPVTIIAQTAGSGNQNGGNIVLTPGSKTGTGTDGLVDLSSPSGTGLKLPATPGNADTQTLDCYQENYASNSWTPVIFGGTTAGTATYSVQEGFYTRWGNLIFCTATVVFSGHTGTGNLSLSGLPFAAKTAGSGTYRSSIIIEEGGGVKAILRLQSGTTATTTGVSIAASGNYVITFVYATN